MDTRGQGAPTLRVVAAVAAPLALMAGTVLAEALQPPGFNPLRATLSDMAGLDAAYREVMTAVIIGMGLWYTVTGWWLAGLRTAARLMLGVGGAACLLIAATPVSQSAVPVRHNTFAAVAFAALMLWPVAGMRRAAGTPWPLRPVAAVTVSTVLCGLFAWFTVSVVLESWMGVPEHILAAILVTWPSVVITASGHKIPVVRQPAREASGVVIGRMERV